jgi:hypothetical protein
MKENNLGVKQILLFSSIRVLFFNKLQELKTPEAIRTFVGEYFLPKDPTEASKVSINLSSEDPTNLDKGLYDVTL